MDKQATDALMQKTAKYIAETQPLLEKYASREVAFMKAAQDAASELQRLGVFSPAQANQFLKRAANEPHIVFPVLTQVAGMIQRQPIGGPAGDVEKVAAAGQNYDEFETYLCSDLIANNRSGTGYVD